MKTKSAGEWKIRLGGSAVALWATILMQPTAAVARDLGDVGLGQDLAHRVCATCHRVKKGETGEKFLDVTAFQTLADSPSKTALNLRVFLKSPHRNMPDLILSEAEIDGVIAYIQSLKSARGKP